jgi:hypothetical protein
VYLGVIVGFVRDIRSNGANVVSLTGSSKAVSTIAIENLPPYSYEALISLML